MVETSNTKGPSTELEADPRLFTTFPQPGSGPEKSQVRGPIHAENHQVALYLQEIADRLRDQGASYFRIRAYEAAALTVRELPQPVGDLFAAGGPQALVDLPHIGIGIATVIEDRIQHGRSRVLDRLLEGDDPERLFRTLPGIGARLARSLHQGLGLESLEDLELACHDGRILQQPGFGARRVESLQAILEKRLRRPQPHTQTRTRPGVELLLAVDELYRDGAKQGRFRLVAPRRLNPGGKAWLPIAHFNRGDWHFTALFSNTALAHRLDRTKDWVILYYYDGDHREGQCTVVTEHRGKMTGKRVVRGREDECLDIFEKTAEAEPRAIRTSPDGRA